MSSTLKRFVKNTVILVFAKALQPLITFYLIITISREIGLAGFGAYSTIFKYVPIFGIIAGFGLRNLLTREISQNRHDAQKYVAAGSILALLFAVFSAILMCVSVIFISDNALVLKGVWIASVSLLAIGLADVYEGAISGFEQIKQVGYALLAENLFRVGLSLLLIYFGFGIIAVVIVFVVGRFLRVTYFYLYLKRNFTNPLAGVDWKILRRLLRQAQTFALIMLCVTIYWNLDGIMLESMRSAEEVGFYSVAYRFLALSMILVHSYVSSLFPVIANFFKSAKEHFQTASRKSIRILILATVPIAVLLSFLAEPIIVFLFSETYGASADVLKILIWGLIPYSMTQIFAYALVASDKQKIDLGINVLSMATNAILNFILIPVHGFMGASVATLISIHVYVFLQIPFVIPKVIHVHFDEIVSYGLRILLATGAMALSLFFLEGQSLLLEIPIALVVYLTGLFSLRLINQSDRQLVYKLVGLAG